MKYVSTFILGGISVALIVVGETGLSLIVGVGGFCVATVDYIYKRFEET